MKFFNFFSLALSSLIMSNSLVAMSGPCITSKAPMKKTVAFAMIKHPESQALSKKAPFNDGPTLEFLDDNKPTIEFLNDRPTVSLKMNSSDSNTPKSYKTYKIADISLVVPASQEESPEISFSSLAKALTLEAGIPFALRQSIYTQLALYPYLWWYKGYRAATEEIIVDSIKWIAQVIMGKPNLIDCSQGGKICKTSQFATTIALDLALRACIVKPFTNKIFGQEQVAATKA